MSSILLNLVIFPAALFVEVVAAGSVGFPDEACRTRLDSTFPGIAAFFGIVKLDFGGFAFTSFTATCLSW